MVKEISLINRLGNKETDIKCFNHLLPTNNIKVIVEPFAGSFAVSKYYYKQFENGYQYHINDFDEMMYYIYTHIDEYIDFYKEMKALYIQDYSNGLGVDFLKHIKQMTGVNENLIRYIIKNKFVRGCLCKFDKQEGFNYNKKEYDMLKTIRKTNQDYKDILNEYKDIEEAFLFIDPPYLFSDNSQYIPQNEDSDMTDILVNILDYLKTCKCKVMLIINRLKILDYLFKDYIKGEYTRTYQISKKQNKHLIITNYTI